MLIDQLSNIVRVEGSADQKVGAESRKRFDDLLAEMKAIETELQKAEAGTGLPDFSGDWTTVSPAARAGQKLTIRQDGATLTFEQPPEWGERSLVYKLGGTTSRALRTADGTVDIVAKTHWSGRSLVVEERRWTVYGQEANNVRQILWLDDGGLLNVEVSTPQPIGQHDVTRLVLRRETAPPPRRNDGSAPH